MAAHQPLGQFAVARGDGLDDQLMLAQGLAGAMALHAELAAVQAREVIKVVTEDLDQTAVAAALGDTEMEVEIAFLLKVALPVLVRELAAVAFEQGLEFGDASI